MVRLINISENRGDLLQNLSYTYDAVGNITKIAQSAGPVNGLGGNYQNSYIYDDLNRLQHSFCKTGLFDYDFNITMSPTGRIGEKNLTYAAGAISSYQLNGYDRNFTTHQPRVIYDQVRGSQSLFWDANGNLSQTVDCKTGAASINFWDEENRLRLAVNPKFVGYYGYDANGERVYKLTGSSSMDDVNAGSIKAQAIFDDAVLYPNPYIVVTPKGYTKHYYAGTERLATIIGCGGFDEMTSAIDMLQTNHDWDIVESFSDYYLNEDPFNYQQIISKSEPTEDIFGNANPDLEYQCQPVELVLVDVYTSQDILLGSISSSEPIFSEEADVYFYHGDHLGSANWITNAGGMPIQYIHYAPYGELIANQQTIGYDERYKFTGKERDAETGYDYFGARFYWSADGIFTTVDPLADKYPNVTPYLYCNGNPIKYVDPDGNLPQMVAGALLSAGADVAAQIGTDMIANHQTFIGSVKNINWKSVAGSAVAGAIGVGVVSKCKQVAHIYKIGKVGTTMATEMGAVAGDAAGSVVSQAMQNGDVSAEKVENDVVSGQLGNLAGKGVIKLMQKSDAFKKLTKEAVNASRRAEARPDLNRNVKAAEKTTQAVENYGANSAQATSAVVSKTISELNNKE